MTLEPLRIEMPNFPLESLSMVILISIWLEKIYSELEHYPCFDIKLVRYTILSDFFVPFLSLSNFEASSGLMLWEDSDDKNNAAFMKYEMIRQKMNIFSMMLKR